MATDDDRYVDIEDNNDGAPPPFTTHDDSHDKQTWKKCKR